MGVLAVIFANPVVSPRLVSLEAQEQVVAAAVVVLADKHHRLPAGLEADREVGAAVLVLRAIRATQATPAIQGVLLRAQLLLIVCL